MPKFAYGFAGAFGFFLLSAMILGEAEVMPPWSRLPFAVFAVLAIACLRFPIMRPFAWGALSAMTLLGLVLFSLVAGMSA